jgi:heat shock protein HtpX
MMSAILLVSCVFTLFLTAVTLLLNLSVVLAFLATLLFLLIQYLIGPAIVRGSTNLRYLDHGENPWLESVVNELCEKSDLKPPKLAIVPDKTPNAFIFGRTSKDATLAVHEGLLRQLNKDEVRAVVGHELGHLKHKDYFVVTMLSALPLLAYWSAWGIFQAVRLGGSSSNSKKGGSVKVALFLVAVLAYAIYIITLLLVKGLSRLREHYADAFSAYVTGQPRQLQSALTKITYGLSLSPKPSTHARTFYIGDPAMAKLEFRRIVERKDAYDLDHDGVLDEHELQLAMEREASSAIYTSNRWLSTHPPTYRRILLLREIEEEMKTGRYSNERIYAHV